MKKPVQSAVEYALMRPLIGFLRVLPYPVSRAMVVGLFLSIGYLFGIRRALAERQLAKVYPDWDKKKRRQTLRRLYRNMALTICEIYVLPEKKLVRTSSVNGMENIREALAMQRGAILATAHFGNWEAARVLPEFGIPLSVVVKAQRNPYFDHFNNAIRTRHGVLLIDVKRGLRDILHELHRNHMVAILMDQNAGKHGLVLDFLGYPATHWVGVAKLSLRYKVPIVPGFALRKNDGTIEFRFEPMIYHPDREDTAENEAALLEEANRIIESYIHRYPDQWLWLHKRWKGTKAMD